MHQKIIKLTLKSKNMCYKPILPTTLNPQTMSESCLTLVYLFNRWAKNLQEFGKLDETSIDEDIKAVTGIINELEALESELKLSIVLCREYAQGGEMRYQALSSQLRHTLKLLCDQLDNASIKKLKKLHSDMGMSEVYRPLSRRLRKEKIRKVGKQLKYIDRESHDAKTTKLVERFVEKRAAQEVYKLWKNNNPGTNWYRQKIRRAKSFNLYNMDFSDYKPEDRFFGTHWAVSYDCKGRRSLKKKRSFNSMEEAEKASQRYSEAHPEQEHPMTAYKCAHCGKFHIGHYRYSRPEDVKQII